MPPAEIWLTDSLREHPVREGWGGCSRLLGVQVRGRQELPAVQERGHPGRQGLQKRLLHKTDMRQEWDLLRHHIRGTERSRFLLLLV